MSHISQCLNCETLVSDKFCQRCGQKTDTHRITLKHFIFHDILHGIWHFEKGILFTLKQAITRPGKAALDYISGKRIRYYNVFYLILLLIGLILFMNSVYEKLALTYIHNTELPIDKTGDAIGQFLTNNSKLLIFSFVPLFAINGFLLFRRRKLNISEHFIIAGMVFLGVMIIVAISNLFFFTDFIKGTEIFTSVINILTPISILAFILISYYRTFRDSYSRTWATLKCFFFMLLLFFELVVLVLILIGFFSNWTYNLKH